MAAQTDSQLITGRPAVFFDRDGTLTEEIGYLTDPGRLRLIPGAGKAVARINRENLLAVLITNQSGAARGLFSLSSIQIAHQRLKDLLAQDRAWLDGIFICPHYPEGSVPELSIKCQCRKPAPGLYNQALKDLTIDSTRSYAVGDSFRDLEPAAGLNIQTVLVLTGHGEKQLREIKSPRVRPDFIADNIGEAVDWILADYKHNE